MVKASLYKTFTLCLALLCACDIESTGTGSDTGGAGQSAIGHTHSVGEHSHGVPEVEAGVWPPRLSNMSDVSFHASPSRSRGAAAVVASARNSLMNNPGLRAALGENFAEFEASVGNAKSGAVASFLFYNYESNQTVDAALLDDGTIRQTVYGASDYQPAENDSEVLAALQLAALTLARAGVDADGLQGTAMLAYPAIGPDALATAPRFFSERILYVTFGEGNGIEPLHSALVNLSTGAVMDYRAIQP